jgi:hypothetical protein
MGTAKIQPLVAGNIGPGLPPLKGGTTEHQENPLNKKTTLLSGRKCGDTTGQLLTKFWKSKMDPRTLL